MVDYFVAWRFSCFHGMIPTRISPWKLVFVTTYHLVNCFDPARYDETPDQARNLL